MPEHERARAIQELTRDLPPRYRLVIEDYFKSLNKATHRPLSCPLIAKRFRAFRAVAGLTSGHGPFRMISICNLKVLMALPRTLMLLFGIVIACSLLRT